MTQKYQVLKKYFGYDSFRPGQETMIDAILAGRDALGIMPTGAGKSICYQVPAILLPGITLVISPLISLMMDQVKALNQAGIHAAYINSSLTEGQIRKALMLAAQGRYRIIYVAPERLQTENFLQFAQNADISMVTVDEAHCISQWGQDFRPSYVKIVDFLEQLPKRPVVSAFTATATQAVKEDISCVLGLRDPQVLVTGFDRENLFFRVEQVRQKDSFLLDYVSTHGNDSGIIYCATRKNVEKVCAFLEDCGIDATRYHAGLNPDERRRNQEDFIYDVKPVMVATNAFGMGIDKSNVRYVIHYNMPQSMENYYQEAGRAGRDGEPSECILLYASQDVAMAQYMIENGKELPDMDEDTRILLLERDRERLKRMTFYCITHQCLRDYILRYFGEYGSNYCGHCSNCQKEFETVDITEEARAIVGCVESCRQRFGVNMILDVLHGANTAKIRSYGMEKNPWYAALPKVSVHRLRQILNELLLQGYLTVTDDGYSIVKLTEKAAQVYQEAFALAMKMVREELPERPQSGKKSRESLAASSLTEEDKRLFEELRTLRLAIAREEKVPPYLIFSDKTLVHMSSVRPGSREEMLQVNGVGEFKLEKYGQSFLEAVATFRG